MGNGELEIGNWALGIGHWGWGINLTSDFIYPLNHLNPVHCSLPNFLLP